MRNSSSWSLSATSSNSSRGGPRSSRGLEPLVVADLPTDPLQLLADDPPHQLGGDRRAVGEGAAVADPLPHLRARDLGRRGVLHQSVDRGGAVAAQPRGDVLDRHADVVAQAGLRDLARRRGDVEQLGRADVDLLARAPDLVGPLAEHRVELGLRGRRRRRDGRPMCRRSRRRPRGACRARDGRDRQLVRLGGRCATGSAPPCRPSRWAPRRCAGADEQLRVGPHERHRHASRRRDRAARTPAVSRKVLIIEKM